MICPKCGRPRSLDVFGCVCHSGPVAVRGTVPVPAALPPMAANMTLRDYFAAKAMQGLMDAAMPMAEIAEEAYQMADLMLKAREE